MGVRRSLIAIVGLLVVAGPVLGQAVTIPEMPEGYQQPDQPMPAPRADYWVTIDIVVLIAALLLAAFLVLKVRRRWPIFALMLASLAYFGFVRRGCVCPIGGIQNVAQAGFDGAYVLPIVVAVFFILPLVAALLFGRTFCAAVCPLGAVQDLVGVKPLRVPRWLEHALGLIAWLYLIAAVVLAGLGAAYIICRYDPFIGIFRLAMTWQMLVVLGCILLIGIFVARPYCRYLCPLGALFRITSPLSWKHARITPAECVQCRLCEDACPYNAILPPTDTTTAESRARGRKALLAALAATPVLVAAFAVGGWLTSGTLSRLHPTVRLAAQVRDEQLYHVNPITKRPEGQTDASKAFWEGQVPASALFENALAVQRRFDVATVIGGGLFGLIIGLKLVSLSVRRTRTDWQTDKATCLSCGRCFKACPVERVRRGEIAPAAVPAAAGEAPPAAAREEVAV